MSVVYYSRYVALYQFHSSLNATYFTERRFSHAGLDTKVDYALKCRQGVVYVKRSKEVRLRLENKVGFSIVKRGSDERREVYIRRISITLIDDTEGVFLTLCHLKRSLTVFIVKVKKTCFRL